MDNHFKLYPSIEVLIEYLSYSDTERPTSLISVCEINNDFVYTYDFREIFLLYFDEFMEVHPEHKLQLMGIYNLERSCLKIEEFYLQKLKGFFEEYAQNPNFRELQVKYASVHRFFNIAVLANPEALTNIEQRNYELSENIKYYNSKIVAEFNKDPIDKNKLEILMVNRDYLYQCRLLELKAADLSEATAVLVKLQEMAVNFARIQNK